MGSIVRTSASTRRPGRGGIARAPLYTSRASSTGPTAWSMAARSTGGGSRADPPGRTEASPRPCRTRVVGTAKKPDSGATRMATILDLAQKVLRGEQPPPPVARLIGFVLKAVEPGRAVFELEAGERRHNPMGTLHGGVYCDLTDAAMGMAYAAPLSEGEASTTVELKINFLRPVRQATLPA